MTKRLHIEKPTFASIDTGKFKKATTLKKHKMKEKKKLTRTQTSPENLEAPMFNEDQIDLRMAVKSSDSSSMGSRKALVNIQRYNFKEDKTKSPR